MKSGNKFLLVLFIAAFLMVNLSGCSDKIPSTEDVEQLTKVSLNPGYNRGRNKYCITVEYNPETQMYYGEEEIFFINNSDSTISEIKFMMYANAFKDIRTAPMTKDINRSYPQGFDEGYLYINGAVHGKETLRYNQSEQVLTVFLAAPLKPGEAIRLKLFFTGKIPRAATPFGTMKGKSIFYNWYPVLAIYENGKWRTDRRFYIGEPNYSETADYLIQIKVPSYLTVAAPGKVVKRVLINDEEKTVVFEAKNIRDFVWVAGEFDFVKKEVKGVTIESYFTRKNRVAGEKLPEMAAHIIEFYSNNIGKYPYDKLVIVETDIVNSGMEYPQLVCISARNYDLNRMSVLRGVLAHEIAHQWWYAAVGNDQFNEPWLDEAFATYWARLYGEKIYGRDYLATTMDFAANTEGNGKAVNFPVSRFGSYAYYQSTVYFRGALLLHKLRQKIGMDRFLMIFKKFYEDFKHEVVHGEAFIGTIREVAGDKAADFFREELNRVGYSDETVKARGIKGPLSHFYEKVMNDEPIVIIYGSQGNRWNRTICMAEAYRLKGFYRDLATRKKGNTGDNIRVFSDVDAKPEDYRSSHLVVLGNPSTNRFYRKINKMLPIQFDEGALVVGNKNYRNPDTLISMVLPNPYNKNKYLVVYGGNNPSLITEIHDYPVDLYDYTVIFYKRGFSGGFFKKKESVWLIE